MKRKGKERIGRPFFLNAEQHSTLKSQSTGKTPVDDDERNCVKNVWTVDDDESVFVECFYGISLADDE